MSSAPLPVPGLEQVEWLLLRYSDREALDYADYRQCRLGVNDLIAYDQQYKLQIACAGLPTPPARKSQNDVVHLAKFNLQLTNAEHAPLLKGPLGDFGLRDTPLVRASLYINMAAWLLGYRPTTGRTAAKTEAMPVPTLWLWSARRSGMTNQLETASWRPNYIGAWLRHLADNPDFGKENPGWANRLVDFGDKGMGIVSVPNRPMLVLPAAQGVAAPAAVPVYDW